MDNSGFWPELAGGRGGVQEGGSRGGVSSILVVTQLLQAEEELRRREGDCWGWVLFIYTCVRWSRGDGEVH